MLDAGRDGAPRDRVYELPEGRQARPPVDEQRRLAEVEVDNIADPRGTPLRLRQHLREADQETQAQNARLNGAERTEPPE